MVTVRQFSRGVGRFARAVERDAQRAARQQALYAKAEAKQALLDASADAVDEHEWLIHQLTKAHQVRFVRKDWRSTADLPLPAEPARSDALERSARAALDHFAPDWFSRTFGLAAGQRAKLVKDVEVARDRDDQAHTAAVAKANARRDEITFAQAVLALNPDAVTKAMHAHAVIDAGAVEAATLVASDGRVVVIVDAPEIDDMPTQSAALLASGKASFKALSQSKIAELHRDCVCSGAIRVAVETLQVLPVDQVEVIAQTDILDRGTGHIKAQPVLYCRVAAQALHALNLELADPTPLVERLGATLNWTKKDGFRAIDLAPIGLPASVREALLA